MASGAGAYVKKSLAETGAILEADLDHGNIQGLGDDDHTQYVLHTEVDDTPVDGVTTDPISSNWAFDHVAAADPHTGYRLESADHSHQTAGAQAGKLDHGSALNGLGDDDHAQYVLVDGSRTMTGSLGVGADIHITGSVYSGDGLGFHTPGWLQTVDRVAPGTPPSAEGRWYQQSGTPYFIDDGGDISALNALGGGVTDHGALTGLGDDDHGQYLLADGTRQLGNDWDAGNNAIQAKKFISVMPSGSAPFEVASPTVVNNLNADLLDDQHAADFEAADAWQAAWPVGSIYIGTTDVNPNTLFGFGTWEAFADGRVLLGLADIGFDTLLAEGGALTHVLDESEIPAHTHVQDAHNHTQDSHGHTQAAHTHTQNAHNHTQNQHRHTDASHDHAAFSAGKWSFTTAGAGFLSVDSGGSVFNIRTGGSGTLTTNYTTPTNIAATATNQNATPAINGTTAINQAATAVNQSTGGGGAHNNVQPYIVVAIWHRTA